MNSVSNLRINFFKIIFTITMIPSRRRPSEWFLSFRSAGQISVYILLFELNDLYSSPNIIRVIKSRRMRWAEHVARMGEGRGAYRILVEKPEGRRPLGRPRRRWEDNIKTDLQDVGWGHGLD
jgi:hypothetical protein